MSLYRCSSDSSAALSFCISFSFSGSCCSKSFSSAMYTSLSDACISNPANLCRRSSIYVSFSDASSRSCSTSSMAFEWASFPPSFLDSTSAHTHFTISCSMSGPAFSFCCSSSFFKLATSDFSSSLSSLSSLVILTCCSSRFRSSACCSLLISWLFFVLSCLSRSISASIWNNSFCSSTASFSLSTKALSRHSYAASRSSWSFFNCAISESFFCSSAFNSFTPRSSLPFCNCAISESFFCSCAFNSFTSVTCVFSRCSTCVSNSAIFFLLSSIFSRCKHSNVSEVAGFFRSGVSHTSSCFKRDMLFLPSEFPMF
mmetsp:Transcript_40519/g.67692  ORF Transcript_40519/g.67692 Transcript_40519/m.67692 type:complete len:314 (-) Transcript_40519:101-1042(-)